MRACIDVRCMYEPMITMFPCRWPYFLKRQVSHVACILMFLILFIFLSRAGGFFLLLSHPHMQTLSKLTCVPPPLPLAGMPHPIAVIHFHFRSCGLPPTHFLYVYEKCWKGGRQIKILESQEKKNTSLIQLHLNGKCPSKLTLQQ